MENKFEDRLLAIINDYDTKIRTSIDNKIKAEISKEAMFKLLYEYNMPITATIYGEVALDSIMKTSNIMEEMQIRLYIGECYHRISNDMIAVSYIEPLITNNFKKLSVDLKYKILFNLVSSYLRINNIKKSQIYLDYFESLYSKCKDSEDVFIHLYFNMIKADFISSTGIGSPNDAMKHLKICKQYYEEYFNLKEKKLILLVELLRIEANIYTRLNEDKKAHNLHLKALNYLSQINIESYYLDFYMLLSNNYKRLGDLKTSVKFLKDYISKSEQRYYDQINQYSDILIKQYGIDYKENHLYKLNIMKNEISNKYNKDSLTGLYNRRFLEAISSNISTNNAYTSIAMIDIDYFKKYNDNYGHLKGDEILKKIGEIISKLFNEYIAVRYGGEEFLIIMENTSYNASINLIDKLIKKIRDENIPHKYSEASDRVTISVGLETAIVCSNTDFWNTIKSADEALYLAKKQGRNKYVHNKDY